jgi:hypothetical protein
MIYFEIAIFIYLCTLAINRDNVMALLFSFCEIALFLLIAKFSLQYIFFTSH